MEITNFHEKLKQHCDKLNGECQQCCFIEYCYSQARDIHGVFLSEIVTRISESEDSDRDINAQVIRNPNNAFALEENSERK